MHCSHYLCYSYEDKVMNELDVSVRVPADGTGEVVDCFMTIRNVISATSSYKFAKYTVNLEDVHHYYVLHFIGPIVL